MHLLSFPWCLTKYQMVEVKRGVMEGLNLFALNQKKNIVMVYNSFKCLDHQEIPALMLCNSLMSEHCCFIKRLENSTHWSGTTALSKQHRVWFFTFCLTSHFNKFRVFLRWCECKEDLWIMLCATVEPIECLWANRT